MLHVVTRPVLVALVIIQACHPTSVQKDASVRQLDGAALGDAGASAEASAEAEETSPTTAPTPPLRVRAATGVIRLD